MTNKRRNQRLAILSVGMLLVMGCHSESKQDSPLSAQTQVEEPDSREAEKTDHLSVARRMLTLGNWDAAAEAAYKALVQDPQSFEAMLVAGEAEAGRGNHELAVELASSIDVDWRLGERVVNLHARSLYELNRTSDAADVLLAGLERMSNQLQWRHRAWGLLTRVGRREEASLQAELLCRAGQATEQELISLIRRTESYPTQLKGVEPRKYFDPGLGMARWYFTQLEYRRALEELAPNFESGFRTAAASALYGRLLAETQSQDQIPTWHAACDLSKVEELGDYWAALGTYFFDTRRYEASAKALLEAVVRNPTDRRSMQRLAKVFDALKKPDQAELFRRRAIDLAHTEGYADSLQTYPATARREKLETRKKLMRQVMELERPFETVAWALRVYPSDAAAERQAIDRQRAELLRSDDALVMAQSPP